VGAYNTACFASRQTIGPGDRCVVVPIQQASTYQPATGRHLENAFSIHGACHSTCYPSRFWEPVAPSLTAVYDDDDAKFILDQTPSNITRLRRFLRECLRRTPVVSQGENPHHEVPYDLPGFMRAAAAELFLHLTDNTAAPMPQELLFEQMVTCWDYVFEVARKQRLFWQGYMHVLRPLQLAVMHQTAYDALVQLCEDSPARDGSSRKMADRLDHVLQAAAPGLEALRTRDPSDPKRMAGLFVLSNHTLDELNRVGSGNQARVEGGEAWYDLFDRYACGTAGAEDLFAAVHAGLRDRYALAGLEILNLHFEPLVYAGQDYGNEVGRAYARFVASVSGQVDQARDHRLNQLD